MTDTPVLLDKTRRELLCSLAAALNTVAQRLQSQENTKRMVFLLAARAEKIGEHAMNLGRTPGQDIGRATNELVQELSAFAAGVTTLSSRVAEDIEAGQPISTTMQAQSAKLMEIAKAAQAIPGRTTILAELRPIASSLTALASRARSDASLATDTAALAKRATELAVRTETAVARAGPQVAARIGADLHQQLYHLADTAAEISVRLAAEINLVKGALSDLAVGSKRLADPASMPASVTPDQAAVARLGNVVRQGQAAMSWYVSTPTTRRSGSDGP